MEASKRRPVWKPAEGRARLALWILAPAIGLAVLFEMVGALESIDCGDADSGASEFEGWAVVATTALLSLAAFAGAAVRLLALRRAARAWAIHRTVFLVGVGAVLLAGVIVALAESEGLYFLGGAWLAGMALTGVALLGLLVAWVRGSGVEGAGGLLPLYLLGAGLFAFPALLLLALLGQSGLGC